MDSKQLTEAKRDSLWEALQTSERVHRVADSHPPRQIRDLRRHAQEAYQVLAAARRPGGCILKEDTLKYKMYTFCVDQIWVHLYTFAPLGMTFIPPGAIA